MRTIPQTTLFTKFAPLRLLGAYTGTLPCMPHETSGNALHATAAWTIRCYAYRVCIEHLAVVIARIVLRDNTHATTTVFSH